MSYNLHVCCSVANKQKLSYENSNWYPEVPASIHVVDHIYRVFRLLGWSQKVNFWLHESAYIARTDWKGGNVTDVLVAGWRVRLVLTMRGRRGRQGGVRGQGEQVPAANHQPPASQTFYPHLFNSCLNAILTTSFLTLPPFRWNQWHYWSNHSSIM